MKRNDSCPPMREGAATVDVPVPQGALEGRRRPLQPPPRWNWPATTAVPIRFLNFRRREDTGSVLAATERRQSIVPCGDAMKRGFASTPEYGHLGTRVRPTMASS